MGPHRTFAIILLAAAAMVAGCGSSATGAGWTYQPVAPTSPAATGSPGAGSPGAGSPAATGPAVTGSPGAPASPTGSPGATGSPAATGTEGATGTGETIELEENASLQILQDGQQVTNLTVKQGQTYTFRVTNTAGFPHNFYIGAPADLQANQTANLQGIPDFASGTQEFQYTVDASTAQLEFACTVPGHYQPMHGTFTVQP